MSWVAVAVGVGSVVTGYLGSQSANKAGKAAQQGSQQAIDEARRQFDLVRGDTAGQRALGNNAISALSRLYGYGPSPTLQSGPAGAPTVSASPVSYGGSQVSDGLKQALIGGGGVGSWLGVGKMLGIGGSKHGDEKRNAEAFFRDNQVYDLGNGKYALADGTTFDQSQIRDLAGDWYGATYAPDGNQADWQQRYATRVAGLEKTPMGQPASAAPGQTAPAATGTGTPDMSVFFASPDYQFRLNEGQKAIDRSAAARGGLLSGGAQREGIRYSSNLASGEYGAFVDRLMQQAGLGSTGIGASAAAGANTASNVGNAAIYGGNAKGSAYMQGASAINNSVQGGISNLLLARYLGG